MKRANLFVLGAQKSGTSSLHYYLKHVNDIYMCDAKETFFFAQDNWQNYDDYHQHYENAGDAKYFGESSTAYTMRPAYPNVAPRLYQYNPQAKLIYIVRDPIERAISNYWWNVHLCQETRSPLAAIKSDDQYIKTSDYAYQIKPYLALFQYEQIKFVLFEDLKLSPLQEVRKICQWLQIPISIDSNDVFSTVRRKTEQKIDQINTNTFMGKLRASQLWQKHLRKFVPNDIRQLGKPLSTQTIDKHSSEILADIDQVKVHLKPLMRPKVDEFSQIASLNFTKWTTVNS